MKASIRATSEEDSVGGRPLAFLGFDVRSTKGVSDLVSRYAEFFCNTCLIHSRIVESFNLDVLPQIFIYHEKWAYLETLISI